MLTWSYQNLRLIGSHSQKSQIIDRIQIPYDRLGLGCKGADHGGYLERGGVIQGGLGHCTRPCNTFLQQQHGDADVTIYYDNSSDALQDRYR